MKQNWVYKKLGDIASFNSGNRPAGGVGRLKEGALSLGGEHIGRNGRIDLSSAKYVSHEYYASNQKGHIFDGDILLCKDGALTGKVAIERGELHGLHSMVNEHVFIIRTTVVSQWYLFYYLFSPTGQTLIQERITGSAQGGINGSQLKTIPIPYPKSIQEQLRIVAELDLLTGIIDKQKAQLKDLDNLAQSIFYDMFGDPMENPKGWDVKPIGNIGKIVTGNTPSRLVKEYYDSPFIEWIKSDNLSNDFMYASKAKEYLSENGALKGRVLPVGSVLVTCIAGSISTIGTASCVDRKVAFNQQINAIVPNEDIVQTLYLLYTVRLMGSMIRACATNGMKHIITKSVFEKIPFVLPPLKLQQEFADKITAIEKQKSAINQSMADTQKLLDYTMDKYFG